MTKEEKVNKVNYTKIGTKYHKANNNRTNYKNLYISK